MSFLRCATTLIDATLGALRAGGLEGVERVVFWLGRRTPDGNADIAEVHVPEQEAAADYFRIPPESMIAFMAHLRRSRLVLLAQVHSHPHEAYHSKADDEWAVVRHEGGLSIVVPSFAADVTAANFEIAAAVFRLASDDRWLRVEPEKLPERLRIT
jgi:proteasome lid subunit RPN8/RPN11